MNESGLSLAVHQHMFSDETRLGGIPAGVMGDIVMRQARNLDEAKEILLSYKPIGCFTYIVTDAKTREVLCVEESPRRKAVIRTTPEYTSFSYANIYFDADLGSREKNLYPSYWRHNQGRQERLRECLALGHGSLDPAAMAGIIADTGGDGCRIRRSVAMLMTVASVVFSPEDGKLWVADGETPTSHGTFLPFSLADEDHAPSLGALRPADEIARPAREGFAAYRSAYLAFVDGGDPRQARQHIESARKLQPQESLYHFMAGLVSLLLEDAEDAALAVSRAIELGHPDPERVATFHLWRARALDILGRRDEALDDYRVPAEANRCDPEVRKAAQKGQRVSYRGKAARRINPEFSFADVVRP
jgi:tetratricopeptide (TPR) repeat protein